MPSVSAAEAPKAGAPTQSVYVGRQPIFDREQNVYAYELLFRSGHVNAAEATSDELATSRVLSTTFIEIGLEQIVGQAKAFINCPRSLLTEPCHLPTDRVVLELLENLTIDDLLVEGCRARREQGYTLALDDFVYSEAWEPLIDLAEIVKLDVLAMSEPEIQATVERLRPRGVKLLAEKVETRAQYEHLRAAGFDYFQGYFLSRPEVVEGQQVPAGSLATLRLLSELQRPDISPEELEALLSSDVNLSYKLLKFVNSPAIGLPRQIESLRHALVLIGLQPLKHWVTLIALTAAAPPAAEVTRNALTRARMCESLARASGQDAPETFFMVGLLSSLEHFLHVPMEQALSGLGLTDECRDALTQHSGALGQAVRCAVAYEMWDWDAIGFPGLEPAELSDSFAEAASWAAQSYDDLVGPIPKA